MRAPLAVATGRGSVSVPPSCPETAPRFGPPIEAEPTLVMLIDFLCSVPLPVGVPAIAPVAVRLQAADSASAQFALLFIWCS